MARQAMKYGSQTFLVIILMIGILFFVNLISARFFIRSDFTENKQYTITDSTKSILQNLDDIVNVKFYLSKDLPPYMSNLENQVKDMLSEYRAYAEGNLIVDFIDPASDPELKQKIQRMGIPELQLTVIEKDQRQVRKAFLGISIQYEDKSEVIPVIRSIENLEYELTSSLFKVTDEKERMIGWVGTRSSENNPNGYDQVQKLIGEKYLIRPIDFSRVDDVQKNLDVLIVDSNENLSERALFAIDQYIMSGGDVIFLEDAIALSSETLSASIEENALSKLTSHYGFSIEPNLIADRYNAYAAFNTGFMRFSLPYPFWPKIQPNQFNQDNPAVSRLESLVLPWTSPISYEKPEMKDRTVSPLVYSSEVSIQISEPFDLNPQQKFSFQEDELETSVLAVMAEGKFSSYFEGKEIPSPNQSSKTENDESEEIVLESTDSTIVIIGNSRFVNNQFVQMFNENVLFLHNLIDLMAIGDQLIGIRSRSVTARPLDFQTTNEQKIEKSKTFHRIFGTFSIPIIAIAFGLVRLSMRLKRKKKGNINNH